MLTKQVPFRVYFHEKKKLQQRLLKEENIFLDIYLVNVNDETAGFQRNTNVLDVSHGGLEAPQ